MRTHVEQFDFRKGRIGNGMRVRQDTKAYKQSVRDARNWSIIADGRSRRRWGTLIRMALPDALRIEPWNYAEGTTTEFLMVFSAGMLRIFDLDMVLRAELVAPWDADAVRYLQISLVEDDAIVTDQSFRPQIVSFDQATETFSIRDFAFKENMVKDRLLAPFYQFEADETRAWLNIFTAPGADISTGSSIAAAGGFDAAGFDIFAGTGRMATDRPVFTDHHVGTRMRLLDGEVEILSVIGPKLATIRVVRDVAKLLDPNPFLMRKTSKTVQVSYPSHNLKVGDLVFIGGLSRTSTDKSNEVLTHAPLHPRSNDSGSPPVGEGGEPLGLEALKALLSGRIGEARHPVAGYRVMRVIDENFFELDGSAAFRGTGQAHPTDLGWGDKPDGFEGYGAFSSVQDPIVIEGLSHGFVHSPGDGVSSDSEGLFGGSDVFIIPFTGITRLKEPAISDARGWPQACVHHEQRLWLAGTRSLPGGIWGSEYWEIEKFDTGEGAPSDAVQLYGLGGNARVRHLVSAFDLIVLADAGEFYIPGSTDSPITQETARGRNATSFGAAFTPAKRFDGGTVFLDAVGLSIREMSAQSKEEEYTTPPLSVAVPEWVSRPEHSAVYSGSPLDATPYLLFTNSDGSLLVLHSSRADDAFGFMRWDLSEGRFLSVAGVGGRLFALAERGEEVFLLEFDALRDDYTTCDFASRLTAEAPSTEWSSPPHAGRTVQLHAGSRVYSDVTVAEDGSFSTPEPLAEICIGDGMPHHVTFHTPVAVSGQGFKSGRMLRIVAARISFDRAETGLVEGQSIVTPQDVPLFDDVAPIDEWRVFHVGVRGREPFVTISGDTPGRIGIRGIMQDVSF